MKTVISIDHYFSASHRVALDPKYSEEHWHRFKFTPWVEGALRMPGWVMDFDALRGLCRELLPDGVALDEQLEDDNATAEKVLLWALLRLEGMVPSGVTVVGGEIEEDDGNRVKIVL